MTKDLPDNTKEVTLRTTAGFTGIEELARRLGSVVPFDSRGKVIYADGFEDALLKWSRDAAAPGVNPVLSHTYAFEGHQSVKLACAIGAGGTSSIGREFSLVSSGKLGVEVWVQGTFVGLSYLFCGILFYDGTNVSEAYLYYDAPLQSISIQDNTGIVTVATGVTMASGSFYFLPIKLVVDIDTDKFVRLVVGSEEYDISVYALNVSGATTDKKIYIVYGLASDVGGPVVVYLDNLIITRDEP